MGVMGGKTEAVVLLKVLIGSHAETERVTQRDRDDIKIASCL